MLSDNYPVFADGMLGRLALGGCQFSLVRHAFHACTQVFLALLIIFCSCLSSYSWVVTAMFHGLVKAKFAIATQPRIYLNPALAHKPTLFSTAKQFTGLQDQLSARMTRHNAVMSQTIRTFSLMIF
jgi:hypothetical protein